MRNRRDWLDLHGYDDYPPDGRDRYEDDEPEDDGLEETEPEESEE